MKKRLLWKILTEPTNTTFTILTRSQGIEPHTVGVWLLVEDSQGFDRKLVRASEEVHSWVVNRFYWPTVLRDFVLTLKSLDCFTVIVYFVAVWQNYCTLEVFSIVIVFIANPVLVTDWQSSGLVIVEVSLLGVDDLTVMGNNHSVVEIVTLTTVQILKMTKIKPNENTDGKTNRMRKENLSKHYSTKWRNYSRTFRRFSSNRLRSFHNCIAWSTNCKTGYANWSYASTALSLISIQS